MCGGVSLWACRPQADVWCLPLFLPTCYLSKGLLLNLALLDSVIRAGWPEALFAPTPRYWVSFTLPLHTDYGESELTLVQQDFD